VPPSTPADEGFVPLFNQQDLSGWTAKRSATIEWKNENGTITGRNRSASLNSAGQLTSQKQYQDFHFRCEVLAGSGVEPVILFRNDDSLVKGSIAEGWGYGALYADDFQVPPHQSRLAPATEKDLGIQTGDWYRLEFIAQQETVEVKINGKQTAAYTSAAPALNKAGSIALRCGAGASIAFRNLEIKELTADPDRRAAEHILGLGGRVRVKHPEDSLQWIDSLARLPAGPPILHAAEWLDTATIDDECFKRLAPCAQLVSVTVQHVQLSNQQLELLGRLTQLRDLGLDKVGMSDEALKHLGALTNLENLYLLGNPLTGEGLDDLAGLENLKLLNLWSTRLSGRGLQCLAHLGLESVNIGGYTGITDAELKHLKGMSTLRSLGIKATKVSEAGVRDLATALPKCRIEWDGGAIEPMAPVGNAAKVKPAANYDKLALGRWMPVLANLDGTTERRNAFLKDGLTEIQNGHAYDKSVSAADLIVRAQVQKLKGQQVQLTLRDVLGVYYFGAYQFDDLERFGIGTRDTRFRVSVKQYFEAAADVPEGEFFELAFAAVGDTLTLYCNGKQIGQIQDASITRPGGVAAHATKGKGIFKDVEVMVLDKVREQSPKE
jgi:hypothetical protein